MTPELSPEPVDVLVVGAGPSGAVISATLAPLGLSVMCLEQGDWMNPTDYPGNYPEWELLIQQQWAHDPNHRRLPADYPIDVADSDLAPVMFNAVGGSTIYYGAHWHRLMPSDFRVRTLDGVADDWPITYEDLAPYYVRAEALTGVSGVGGDPAYPDHEDYPLPPLPFGKVGRRAAEAANKLGWHWWPGNNAIPSADFRNLSKCARYGVCEWGCPQSAKASADVAWWPHALKSGATLVTGARVRRIETGPDGRATGATWIDRSGRERFQPARSVVMCSNGIGTPRLLLMSSSASHPDGLANSSGLVGKNLQLHPNAAVYGSYDECLESWLGPTGQAVHSLEFYDTKADRGFVRGAKLHAIAAPGPLAALEVRRWGRKFDDLWGAPIHQAVRTHGSGIYWAANTEDLPEEHNRVTLSAELVDSDGLPAPKVSYRISDNTQRILDFTVARMRELHVAGGATEIIEFPLIPDQPGHLLGTARMGSNAASSVVSSFGQAHDVDNLFIADGSIFVTTGSVNPTGTIHALALRVADGIAAYAKRQEALA